MRSFFIIRTQLLFKKIYNDFLFSDYNSVEDYWDALTEYEGGMLKVRELWDNIKSLYTKLHKYIALRLKGTEAVGKPLPIHVLSKSIRIAKSFYSPTF